MAAPQEIMKKSTDTVSVFDRVPPQAIEAERAILASIMLDNECIGRVIEYVDADCFYRTGHGKIFESIIALYERNEPIDLITLSEELKRLNLLDAVGGANYLAELVDAVPSAANVEYHSRIVMEKYLLRRLITESGAIAKDSFESADSVYDLIDRSEARIFRLSEKRLRKGFVHVRTAMQDTMEQIEDFHQRAGKVTGVPTGFTKMDEMTSGFQNGELIIVAGRPSMGKTAFCLNLARNAAIDARVPVGFFSLEMSTRSLAMRLLCAEARVDAHKVRTGTLPDEDWPRLSKSVGLLTDAPIYIDDTGGLSILEVRTKARRLRKEQNIGLIVIDYLQLMSGRQQEISTISRSLKALAKELDVPVVALSQLSRAVEQRGGEHRPMLSDLRESGAIEQDADVVMFVYRPEFYGKLMDENGMPTEGKAEIIIGKQRNGPIGTVPLSFIKRYARFENLAFEEEGGVPF